jgi:hypothetical protein
MNSEESNDLSEARNHFEKARNYTADHEIIDMLEGLKHLAHAIEKGFRTWG